MNSYYGVTHETFFMAIKHLTALIILSSLPLLMHAQDKLPFSISAAIGYPLSFGSNSLELSGSILAYDVNAQIPLSGKISAGPSYRAGIYDNDITYTDENGNDIPDSYVSLLHHLELLSEYHLKLDERVQLLFGLAAGYSFINTTVPAGFPAGGKPKGLHVAPGITFQYALSGHVNLLSSAKYTFSRLNSTIDAGGTYAEYNESIHEATLAVGAAYVF